MAVSYQVALTAPSDAAVKPTCTLKATPATITQGQATVLSWTAKYASTGTINHNIGAVNPNNAAGIRTEKPLQTITYVLTVNGPGGSGTCSKTVTVNPPPPPTCPAGTTGTYPNCVQNPPQTCPAGTTGTYPNCATVNSVPPPPSCASGTTGTYPNCVKTISNVMYDPSASGFDFWHALDICEPATPSSSPLPVLLFIHGGSFIAGNKGDFESDCQTAAAMGMTGVTINYRLVGTSNNGIYVELNDAQLAVRWLKSNATTYNIDPNKICAWGDSAGGYFSAALGVWSDIKAGDKASLFSNISPKVACVVDNSGPVDFLTYLKITASTTQDTIDAYKAASPLYSVDSTSAPMYITQGTNDTLVSPTNSQELYAALQAAGVPSTLIMYNGGHVFTGLPAASTTQIINDELNFAASQLSQ